MVYNSILGGGIHSKLFQNVREGEHGILRIFRLESSRADGCARHRNRNKDKALDIIQNSRGNQKAP